MTKSERVMKVVAEEMCLDINEVTGDSTFESLGADSLDTVEVVMAIEETFDIEISDKDAEAFTTVQDIIDHVEANT
jgi:acyl carrier protein